MKSTKRKARGFTLIEVLISLAIIAMISLVLMPALGPWLNLKQKMDTERRLHDIKQGVSAMYEAQGMAIDAQPSGSFKEFTDNAVEVGSGGCVLQDAGFVANSTWFSEPAQALSRDGYSNPWCIRISPSLSEVIDGVELWYRNISIISTGRDGQLDEATGVSSTGVLTLAGDDFGITISGREVQSDKLRETLRRMTRAGQTYETYFTVRYLANPARDITVDYFSSDFDTSGVVASTGGAWAPISTALGPIGVAGIDTLSAWESDNNIEMGNFNETVNGIQVRSPGSTGTGTLPFTALIRARVPAPAGTLTYVLQGVVGNY
jgi:prepilin-type N-terminal cleavage/methylation domain-containing protein